MQSDYNQIYKICAKREGKSEQLYKDVGNFVFSKLYKKMRRPNHLIIKLKGIGSWYLRKRRIETLVNLYPPAFKEFPESNNIFDKLRVIKYENKVEIYNIFKDRIEDYKKYILERNEIRKKRNETQTLLKG